MCRGASLPTALLRAFSFAENENICHVPLVGFLRDFFSRLDLFSHFLAGGVIFPQMEEMGSS